jgi:hypothetical protein
MVGFHESLLSFRCLFNLGFIYKSIEAYSAIYIQVTSVIGLTIIDWLAVAMSTPSSLHICIVP